MKFKLSHCDECTVVMLCFGFGICMSLLMGYQFKVFQFTFEHPSCHALKDRVKLRLVSFVLSFIITVVIVGVGWLVCCLQPQQAVDCAAQQVTLWWEKRHLKKHVNITKKKSNNANIVPGAPEGRPGLQELWCMVLTSLAAAVLLQVHSTVWAKHTTRYSVNVMARMTNRLKHLKHLQYLRQERLHDRARKLRVTT